MYDIFCWCLIFLTYFAYGLRERCWLRQAEVIRHIIFVYRIFLVDMKRTDKYVYAVDEKSALPLTIGSLCRHCQALC